MISPTVATRMQLSLGRLQADADRAEAAAPGLVSRWWASAIGADTTASAAAGLATAARRDADRFEARYRSLLADASASDADGERFISDAESSYAGGAAGDLVAEVGALLAPSAAVVETVKGTAEDIASGVKSALPWVGIAVTVAGIAVGLLVLRDARRAARA